MYDEIISKMLDKKFVYKKNHKVLSLREKVLSLVAEANKNAPLERRVVPRSALTVMSRSQKQLSALSNESRELGVLREVAKFITAHVDTFKAHEYDVNTDLLPVGHPKALSNLSVSASFVREKYAQWLASDPLVDDSVKSLVASAYSLQPGTVERAHAFARLRITRTGSTPSFFKIDSIPALVAAFTFSAGNSSAARRARVALQWRDRKGRWVEMGRGIDFNFRLPNGDIANAGGSYVGVNAARGYSSENGKPVANAGLVEVRGNPNIPDGIYSIESANASPVKARIPGRALKKAGVKRGPATRTPTAEESLSKDIPNIDDLLKTRVDAPSGWTKQKDGSFISDDDYKAIPNKSGFSLHRLNEDGDTGTRVAEVSTWADVQKASEVDSNDYEKFKRSASTQADSREDDETSKGIEGARAAQQERLAESIYRRRTEDGESLEEVAQDLGMTREQVRRIESDYMRKIREGGTSETDGKHKTVQEVKEGLDNIFENTPKVDYAAWAKNRNDSSRDEIKYPILPEGTQILTNDAYNNIVRYPDGSYAVSAPEGDFDSEKEGTHTFTRLEDLDNSPSFMIYDAARDTEVSATGPEVVLWSVGPDAAAGGMGSTIVTEEDARKFPVEETTPNYRKADMQAQLLRPGYLLPTYFPTPGGQRALLAKRDRDPNYEMPPADEVTKVANMRGNPRKLVITVRELETGNERKFGINKDSKLYDVRIPQKAKEALPSETPADTPPSPAEGTLPKVPSPSSPSTPGLFKEFDVPNGAFQLRTVDYEPDGRIDEESTDFTDDPSRLAVKYTLPELTTALTQALIGDKSDSVIEQIVDSSIGDDDESLDIEEVNDAVQAPAVVAGRAAGTGAGQLEFNRGPEFVPAEALYNAVFLAGGDPNRVIANAYDAVNGNRNNLDKLHNAAGGVPDAEEAKLIDDIFEEIKQIKEVSTPEEEEQKAANPIEGADEEKPLPGELLYNIPIDFDNPDYYNIDTNPYPAMLEQPDENGYSDNPEFIARNFAEADLLEQFENSIVDGSGTVLLIYNDEVPLNEGAYEVPAEAIRDALQLKGINTNDVLERIRSSSVDFEKEEEPKQEEPKQEEPEQETEKPSQPVAQDASMDDVLGVIKERHGDDLSNFTPVAYLPSNGSIVYRTADDELYLADREGRISLIENVDEEWILSPEGAGSAGWRKFTDEEKNAFNGSSPQAAPAEPTAPEAPAAPAYPYPGPAEPGYSRNNTTVVRGGAVVGQGARVVAIKDNKTGTVVSVQNNPEYIKIKFDDGTTAVRAAGKVKALSNADGAAPVVVEKKNAEFDSDVMRRRLDAPAQKAPRIARSGETRSVNDESVVPDFVKELANSVAVQSDFSDWGSRDAEIAKAANQRATLESLFDMIDKHTLMDRGQDRNDLEEKIKRVVSDIFGDRPGITFGGEFFSLETKRVDFAVASLDRNGYATKEDIENKTGNYNISASFNVRNASGNNVGVVTRSIHRKSKKDADGNIKTEIYVKNDLIDLKSEAKETGFSTGFNRYVDNWYIANGIKEVRVYAAGGGHYQGGFVWALAGFEWDKNFNEPDLPLRQLKRAVKNKQEEEQVAAIEKKLKDAKLPNGSYDLSKAPSPMEYALVGYTEGATNWLGKRVMTQTSWNGIKHLNPTARGQVQLVNYNQIKNAARRIKDKQNIPNVSSEFLSVVTSDKFKDDKDILPYVDEVRDVLKNNRSLAYLAPDAKAALGRYLSSQLLTPEKDRQVPLKDLFSLRKFLNAEYRADYQYSNPFEVGNILAEAEFDDFIKASQGSGDLFDSGFEVRLLGYQESGVNNTFRVTHTPSGQVFYVKNDNYVTQFTDYVPGVSELEAATILNAAGLNGVHQVRAGQNERNLIIMSEAGSTIPMVDKAVTGYSLQNSGAVDTSGRKRAVDFSNMLDIMAAPEDIIRMSLLDILTSNEDRHNANWLAGYNNTTGKLRIFPIDNTVGTIEVNDSNSMEEFINMGSFADTDVYKEVMPELISRMGGTTVLEVYKNEVKNIVDNLNNPLYEPKGFEMDKIIEKWGTYDAFKDAVARRLERLVTEGTNENGALKYALRLGYWS